MAAHQHSSTRRRVLGAAVALPFLALSGLPAKADAKSSPAQALREGRWNSRLARYRILHARWKAEAETGAFRRANDEYNRARTDLIARFGSWEKALLSRIGKPLCQAAFALVTVAEDAFYETCTAPMCRAAARLIRTRAPDPNALLMKIEIIREHDLDSVDDMPVHSLETLRADVARLAGIGFRTAE